MAPATVVLKSRAQVADLPIDHVAFGYVLCPPRRVEDLLASDDTAGVASQVGEDAVLGRGQVDGLSITQCLVLAEVNGQVAGGDLLVTPYLAFTRKSGLSARELAQAIIALTRIALPGVDVKLR